MRVLVIDNNIDPNHWGATALRRFSRLAPGATFHVRRGPQGDFPESPSGFDRIIISGSKTSAMEDAPWISSLHRLIKSSINESKPLLGVCYGHQALVRALGGKELMRRGQEAEFGWVRIELLPEPKNSPLFEGLPRTFHSFGAHFEEVSGLPAGLRTIARSDACEIQACQLEDKPVFGIQFHPEKNQEDAEKVFQERKKVGEPRKLLHPGRSAELYDPKVGEAIFGNFLKMNG